MTHVPGSNRFHRALRAEVDGVGLNYQYDPAPSNPDQAIVFIHGYAASLESWNDLWPLRPRDWPAYRLDLKGFGFSDIPDDGAYTPNDQADLVAGFVATLPQRTIVLVGHSYGGGVAIMVQQLLNDSSATDHHVKALVLIDPAVYPQEYPFMIEFMRSSVQRRLASLFTTSRFRTKVGLDRLFVGSDVVNEERITRYDYFYHLPNATRGMVEVARQLDAVDRTQWEASVDSVDVPSLLIWGSEDPVISVDNGPRLAEQLGDARLIILDGIGHVPHEQAPQAVANALHAFLADL